MAAETVSIAEAVNGVVTLTLNRPNVLNAFDMGLATELDEAVAHLSADPLLRVLVIQGAGRAFCSGADLRERPTLSDDQIRRKRELLISTMQRLAAMDAPVIASCHGAVVAGGFELALACDIRVAEGTSRWALPELRTVGAFPGALAPIILEKLLPRGMARMLVFTGSTITGIEAHRIGLVDVLCEPHTRGSIVADLSREIASSSPVAVARAKRLMVAAHDLPTAAAIDYSRSLRDSLDAGPDSREAVQAWLEKRPPVFGGHHAPTDL